MLRYFAFAIALLSSVPISATELCHYRSYQRNTVTRKAVNHQLVEKPRSQLTNDERDSNSGCSVCEEDQTEIRLPNLKPFKVCKQLAVKIETLLRQLQQQNAVVLDVVAYRVGKTRGDIDQNGNRTQFSNHSFGTAFDINTDQNGLYENCLQFGPQCRLIKGGAWRVGQFGSLTADSVIVQTLKANGFKWGGEIGGQQKDFMHFSLTGY